MRTVVVYNTAIHNAAVEAIFCCQSLTRISMYSTQNTTIYVYLHNQQNSKSQRVTPFFFFVLSPSQFACAIERQKFYLLFVFTLYIDKSHRWNNVFKNTPSWSFFGRLSNSCWFKVDSPWQKQRLCDYFNINRHRNLSDESNVCDRFLCSINWQILIRCKSSHPLLRPQWPSELIE